MSAENLTSIARRSPGRGLERLVVYIVFGALVGASASAQTSVDSGSENSGILRGEVVDPLGQRIAGASITLEFSSGESLETASDADGTFEFTGVPTGTHHLRISSPGFQTLTETVDIDIMERSQVTHALEIEGITSKVTVTAPSPEGYDAPQAAAATRLNIPILQTPFSVQVIPSRVIKDQNALGLEEIYTNVSGITEAGNTLNAQTEIRPVIRGFEAAILLRNGLRATTVGAIDTVNIESVEVLKGPASILYGALEPGGVLNYTTKKPLMAPQYEVTQQFGTEEHIRTTFDATGPDRR